MSDVQGFPVTQQGGRWGFLIPTIVTEPPMEWTDGVHVVDTDEIASALDALDGVEGSAMYLLSPRSVERKGERDEFIAFAEDFPPEITPEWQVTWMGHLKCLAEQIANQVPTLVEDPTFKDFPFVVILTDETNNWIVAIQKPPGKCRWHCGCEE